MTENLPLLLGHRGARRAAPENTLKAFDLALAHGCDGFEFDVRWTVDQRAIVCHDPRLSGLLVAKSEYAQIVQSCRAKKKGNNCQNCEVIPCLDDVVARYAGRAYLDIELKVTGLEEKVVALVRSLSPETCVLSSFLPEVLRSIHRLQSAIPLGFICDRASALRHWRELPCTVVIPERSLVGEELVGEVHNAEKKIFVWTANDREEMLRFRSMGVDAIISDDTELLGRTARVRGRGSS